MATAVAGPADLRAYVCIQDSTRGKATVFETAIQDYTKQSETNLAKRDLADMILYLRTAACQDAVGDTYVREAISKNTITIVMFERTTEVSRDSNLPVEKPKGFILARLDEGEEENNNNNNNNNNNSDNHNSKNTDSNEEPTGVYIDIICSAAFGSYLLKFFIEMIEDMDNIDYIKLSSLPSVLAYYPKFKFKFRKSCNSPVLADVPDVIIKRKKNVKPFPITSNAAEADEDFSSFMLKLHQKGLSVDKEPPCDKLIIDKKTMIDNDCDGQGYTMIRCKSDLKGGKRKTYRKNKKSKRSTRKVYRS